MSTNTIKKGRRTAVRSFKFPALNKPNRKQPRYIVWITEWKRCQNAIASIADYSRISINPMLITLRDTWFAVWKSHEPNQILIGYGINYYDILVVFCVCSFGKCAKWLLANSWVWHIYFPARASRIRFQCRMQSLRWLLWNERLSCLCLR